MAGGDVGSAPSRVMGVRVIGVASQVGSGGDVIAQNVAAQLGFRYLDREIVERAAARIGVTPETVRDFERKHSLVERLFESMAYAAPFPGPEMGFAGTALQSLDPLRSSDEYRQLLEDAVLSFAAQGQCVIVGHGAGLLLSGRLDTLRVLITGSAEVRARRLATTRGLDVARAARTVAETDRERLDYFRSYYRRDWLDPAGYSVCINSDEFAVTEAASLVLAAARGR